MNSNEYSSIWAHFGNYPVDTQLWRFVCADLPRLLISCSLGQLLTTWIQTERYKLTLMLSRLSHSWRAAQHIKPIAQLSQEILKSDMWHTFCGWKPVRINHHRSTPKANHTLTVIAGAHDYLTGIKTTTHIGQTQWSVLLVVITLFLLLSWLDEIRSSRCLDAICLQKLCLISVFHTVYEITDLADSFIAVQEQAPPASYTNYKWFFNPVWGHKTNNND